MKVVIAVCAVVLVGAGAGPRMGRGLEDLGLGVCHQVGAGWRGDNLTLADLLEIRRRRGAGRRAGQLVLYWPQLVARPNCVDWLEVKLGTASRELLNPADRASTRQAVSIARDPCSAAQQLVIRVGNTRGGFNISLRRDRGGAGGSGLQAGSQAGIPLSRSNLYTR